MNKSDAVIRHIAFFFSLALYLTLLPIILSYSLGYHIDFHKLVIYKTGILSLRSTPSGASIYVNGKLYPDITPARIEELRPGTYSIEVRREGLFPWQKDLAVRPNMVTRAENILLFPTLQVTEKVGDREADNFFIPDDRSQIYYMTKAGLYGSNIDGTNPKKLSSYSGWPSGILGKKLSPDGKKILYFNENGIWIIYLNGLRLIKSEDIAEVEEVLKSPDTIKDVFWHSGSNHIIFAAGRDINVLEIGKGGGKNIVTLNKCSRQPQGVYYDVYNDSLYFNDSPGGKSKLYRLDLREKFFGKFMERIKKEFDIIYEKR
ncbi:MAG: PEGA domain-containing protein [Candidatus Omnitrophota bacterium]|nr:PEGA domain-containing protein [Candidatus Omnitrophota bacterium]